MTTNDQLWTPSSVLKRAIHVLTTEGLSSLWFRILGETIYRRATLMERLLDEPIHDITARIPVEIELLTESHIEEYCRFRNLDNPEIIRNRLQRGEYCLVARCKAQIVHAGWIALGRACIDYLQYELELAPDEAFLFDVLTHPDYRGHNISPFRLSKALNSLRKQGIRRVICIVMPENKNAFRPMEKNGFQRIGTIGYWKIGHRRFHFYRLGHGFLAPGSIPEAHDDGYWDQVNRHMRTRTHYLDPFLADLKRKSYIKLIQNWNDGPQTGRVLKTDLFEESVGGDGFLGDLKSNHNTLFGMDLSPGIANGARKRDSKNQSHYLAADARHLPFSSGSFELIISPSTLDHFSDPDDLGRSLRELDRILQPDGRLIITLDNRQNIFDPLLRLAIRLGLVPYYVGRSYSYQELSKELQAAGFAVKETTSILHNPRLVAVALATLTHSLGFQPLIRLYQKTLTQAQRLENSCWKYRTGSFVAANAITCKRDRKRPSVDVEHQIPDTGEK